MKIKILEMLFIVKFVKLVFKFKFGQKIYVIFNIIGIELVYF